MNDIKSKLNAADLLVSCSCSLDTVKLLRVNIMFQHSPRGVTSQHPAYLQLDKSVSDIKVSMENQLKVPADCQRWFYKNKELKNSEKISDKNMKTDDYIHVKTLTDLPACTA